MLTAEWNPMISFPYLESELGNFAYKSRHAAKDVSSLTARAA